LLEEKDIRLCSAKERVFYTGTARRAAYMEKLKVKKNIKDIETNMPTIKVINEQKTG
jgi:hypothetical protein